MCVLSDSTLDTPNTSLCELLLAQTVLLDGVWLCTGLSTVSEMEQGQEGPDYLQEDEADLSAITTTLVPASSADMP